MNPYEAPTRGIEAAAKRPRRLAFSLLRIGGVLAVGGIAGFVGVIVFVQVVYHGYGAPIGFQLVGFTSLAMFPIGVLTLLAGLFFLAIDALKRRNMPKS